MGRKRTELWKTRDGQKIRVCDMDDRHLRHAMAMLKGGAYRALWNHASRDRAAAESATWDDYVPGIYFAMAGELRERNATVSV